MKTLTNTLGLRGRAGRLLVFAVIAALLITAFMPIAGSAVYGEATSGGGVVPAQCTVTFRDIDGTVLKTQVVNNGEDATPPTIVAKKGYKFLGWDNEYTNVTENRTVNAVYELIMTTTKEKDGKLAAPDTAQPPAEIIAVATEGGMEVIDTSEEAITTPEIIKTNPTPTTVVEEPEQSMSPTTIILIVLAALVALAVIGYFIFMFLKKRRKEEYTS